MNSAAIVKIIIAIAVITSIMKIFGTKGMIVILGICAAILFAIYKLQNKLLYMPDIPNSPHSPAQNIRGYRHPSEEGVNTENVQITTPDNVKIRGWLATHENTQRIVVYFHQNAGNIGWRIPFLKNIHTATNSDVLLIAYRGYSDSEGEPTQEGLQLDAQTVMDYAISIKERALAANKRKNIYLLGRSLGGAVSIYIATQPAYKDQISGLILENTFTSIQDMVKVVLPPLSYLQPLHRNFWPSKQRIPLIQTPILFIRSLKDEIVPTEQMQQLIRLATNCRSKSFHEIPRGTHNLAWEINPAQYFEKLRNFFQEVEEHQA